jgi:hypothetical protein
VPRTSVPRISSPEVSDSSEAVVPKEHLARAVRLVRYYRRIVLVLIASGAAKAAYGLSVADTGDVPWWASAAQGGLCIITAGFVAAPYIRRALTEFDPVRPE